MNCLKDLKDLAILKYLTPFNGKVFRIKFFIILNGKNVEAYHVFSYHNLQI